MVVVGLKACLAKLMPTQPAFVGVVVVVVVATVTVTVVVALLTILTYEASFNGHYKS